MKTRNELIEEIVEEYKLNTSHLADSDIQFIEDFLRFSLLKISDVSMDAVEVEENDANNYHKSGHGELDEEALGWNAARAASQKKREEWTKV